jgi:hypothetical protein
LAASSAKLISVWTLVAVVSTGGLKEDRLGLSLDPVIAKKISADRELLPAASTI